MSEFDIPQPYFLQRRQASDYFLSLLVVLLRAEELHCLCNCHLEHVVNVHPVIFHLQRVGVEPPPVTSLTLERDVGHELHFDRDPSLALALLAAATLLIEREMGWHVTHLLRQRLFGKEFPYFFIHPDISDGI